MIKITSELKTNSAFRSTISVLEVTSYTVTETISLVANTPMPTLNAGKNIMVYAQVYKSATDKASGAAPYSPIDFPYSFNLQPAADDVVTEEYIYAGVLAKLQASNYNAEIL